MNMYISNYNKCFYESHQASAQLLSVRNSLISFVTAVTILSSTVLPSFINGDITSDPMCDSF